LFAGVDIYHSINKIFSDRYKNLLGKEDSILESPQGVDIEIFNPADEKIKVVIKNQLGIPENVWVILSVGFMIPRKGFSGIFDLLKDIDIPYVYIIAGEYDFPRDHFLYRFAETATETIKKGKALLGRKLILAGPVKEIEKYYQVADIILFNSVQEGLPNCMLEAMACGVPILTRNIPGLESFILHNGENCLIFNNEKELGDQIQFLYSNKKKAREISAAAISDIRQKASFQNVLSGYYQQLL
jgi:glycosyltransferase involved in cell wall biosynthesis